MLINITKLLFLYRSILFKKTRFTTNNKELTKIVKALNIKKQKERITYVYDEAIKEVNKYYSKDLCQFIGNKCIAQRKNNSNHVDGCCYRCPINTTTGCPTASLNCKLIYCKTAIKNMKKLKFSDIKILKCLSPIQRLILR